MLKIRERQLRVPLGMSLSNPDLEGEDKQYHFGLFDSLLDQCVCIALSMENSGRRGKLIQMTVEKKFIVRNGMPAL